MDVKKDQRSAVRKQELNKLNQLSKRLKKKKSSKRLNLNIV